MPQRDFFSQGAGRGGKVDPRIVSLLTRSDQQLAQLQADERRQLAARRARIRTLEKELLQTTDDQRRQVIEAQLRILRSQRISPLTTGIALPRSDTPGRPRWVRQDEIHLSALIEFDGSVQDLEA